MSEKIEVFIDLLKIWATERKIMSANICDNLGPMPSIPVDLLPLSIPNCSQGVI